MIFIFVLALLLFGPKKLPEVGRTLGKAMSEFWRASSELKVTFDREMKTLERRPNRLRKSQAITITTPTITITLPMTRDTMDPSLTIPPPPKYLPQAHPQLRALSHTQPQIRRRALSPTVQTVAASHPVFGGVQRLRGEACGGNSFRRVCAASGGYGFTQATEHKA
jgi:TatA/E family protein of Tat protein translocase